MNKYGEPTVFPSSVKPSRLTRNILGTRLRRFKVVNMRNERGYSNSDRESTTDSISINPPFFFNQVARRTSFHCEAISGRQGPRRRVTLSFGHIAGESGNMMYTGLNAIAPPRDRNFEIDGRYSVAEPPTGQPSAFWLESFVLNFCTAGKEVSSLEIFYGDTKGITNWP